MIRDDEMLEARLRTLESRNRWLGRAFAVLLVGAAIQVTVGYASSTSAPRVIEAEQFVVRDGSGRDLAMLGADAGGNAGLAFNDASGRTRAALGLKSDGTSGLVLNDERGEKRASLSTRPNGKAGLSLFDDQGKIRAGIALNERGVPTTATLPPPAVPRGTQ
jgi:hypothetical protein